MLKSLLIKILWQIRSNKDNYPKQTANVILNSKTLRLFQVKSWSSAFITNI